MCLLLLFFNLIEIIWILLMIIFVSMIGMNNCWLMIINIIKVEIFIIYFK